MVAAEKAALSITEADGGQIRIEVEHPEARTALYFSTPADAWKFGQAVAAFAVKMMQPVEVTE